MRENRGFSVEIVECSKKLTAKERIAVKDTSDAIKLDAATQEGAVIIDPDYFAVLKVHNEKSDDKEYTQYIIADKSGERYCTGSESFMNAFLDIFDEMAGEKEAWAVKAYRLPSKNRQGKDFITCSIV